MGQRNEVEAEGEEAPRCCSLAMRSAMYSVSLPQRETEKSKEEEEPTAAEGDPIDLSRLSSLPAAAAYV